MQVLYGEHDRDRCPKPSQMFLRLPVEGHEEVHWLDFQAVDYNPIIHITTRGHDQKAIASYVYTEVDSPFVPKFKPGFKQGINTWRDNNMWALMNLVFSSVLNWRLHGIMEDRVERLDFKVVHFQFVEGGIFLRLELRDPVADVHVEKYDAAITAGGISGSPLEVVYPRQQ